MGPFVSVTGRTLLAAIAAALATSAPLATASPATVVTGGGRPAGGLTGRAVTWASVARAAVAPAASCAEPNCDVTYHGGPVIRPPRVYLYFWGPKWKTAAVEQGS